jgi:hypothetical protein
MPRRNLTLTLAGGHKKNLGSLNGKRRLTHQPERAPLMDAETEEMKESIGFCRDNIRVGEGILPCVEHWTRLPPYGSAVPQIVQYRIPPLLRDVWIRF